MIICTDGLANKGVGTLDGRKYTIAILPCRYTCQYMYTVLCRAYTAYVCVCSPTELATDEEQAEAQTFYEDLGTLALEKKLVTLFMSRWLCIVACVC